MKFEIFKGKNGEFYFRGKAGNGEVIFLSEGYKQKASAKHTIEVIKRDAGDAEVVDTTTEKE